MIFSPAGELLAPVAAEAMEEGPVSDDVGATAGDSDDSLQQSSVQLLETIDEPLTHDMTGTSFAFVTTLEKGYATHSSILGLPFRLSQ